MEACGFQVDIGISPVDLRQFMYLRLGIRGFNFIFPLDRFFLNFVT